MCVLYVCVCPINNEDDSIHIPLLHKDSMCIAPLSFPSYVLLCSKSRNGSHSPLFHALLFPENVTPLHFVRIRLFEWLGLKKLGSKAIYLAQHLVWLAVTMLKEKVKLNI